jgi:hypothetical protein
VPIVRFWIIITRKVTVIYFGRRGCGILCHVFWGEDTFFVPGFGREWFGTEILVKQILRCAQDDNVCFGIRESLI